MEGNVYRKEGKGKEKKSIEKELLLPVRSLHVRLL